MLWSLEREGTRTGTEILAGAHQGVVLDIQLQRHYSDLEGPVLVFVSN